MNKPTLLEAEEAAKALGLDTYDLANQLREAAADALIEAARSVRMGDPLDVGRARRLLRAAEACHDAWLSVEKAKTDD